MYTQKLLRSIKVVHLYKMGVKHGTLTHILFSRLVLVGRQMKPVMYTEKKPKQTSGIYKTLIGFPAIPNFGLNVGAIIIYLIT